jgi:hypothetical protein
MIGCDKAWGTALPGFRHGAREGSNRRCLLPPFGGVAYVFLGRIEKRSSVTFAGPNQTACSLSDSIGDEKLLEGAA